MISIGFNLATQNRLWEKTLFSSDVEKNLDPRFVSARSVPGRPYLIINDENSFGWPFQSLVNVRTGEYLASVYRKPFTQRFGIDIDSMNKYAFVRDAASVSKEGNIISKPLVEIINLETGIKTEIQAKAFESDFIAGTIVPFNYDAAQQVRVLTNNGKIAVVLVDFVDEVDDLPVTE